MRSEDYTNLTVSSLEEIPSFWRTLETGRGKVVQKDVIRLSLPAEAPDTHTATYSNAQLDDYPGIPRKKFLCSPPLSFSIKARFSHSCTNTTNSIRGTAGFGFWNDPFMMTESRPPTLPRALWFFLSSPDSDLRLVENISRYGFKAATLDAWRLPFLSLIPTIPLSLPLMQVPYLKRKLWPLAQRAMNCNEHSLNIDLTEFHSYRIEWRAKKASFFIDEQLVYSAPPPQGPLALVIWIDNQFMVLHPTGYLKHGNLAIHEEQYLEIESISLQRPQ